jgi:hypothetical protein
MKITFKCVSVNNRLTSQETILVVINKNTTAPIPKVTGELKITLYKDGDTEFFKPGKNYEIDIAES